MIALLGFESREKLIGAVILDFAPAEFHKDWKFLQRLEAVAELKPSRSLIN